MNLSRQILWIGLGQMAISGVNLMLVPIVTNLGDESQFGTWTQYRYFVSLLIPMLTLSLGSGLARFLPRARLPRFREASVYTVYRLVAMSAGVAGVILILCSGHIAELLFSNNMTAALAAIISAIAQAFVMLKVAVYRAQQRMNAVSTFLVGEAIVILGCIVLVQFAGGDVVDSLFFITVARVVVALIVVFDGLIKKPPAVSRPVMHRYLAYSIPFVPTVMAVWVISASDRFVIAALLGAQQNGIYSAAYEVATIPLLLTSVLGFVLAPALTKLNKYQGYEAAANVVRQAFMLTALLLGAFIAYVGLFGELLLQWFSNDVIAKEGLFVLQVSALGTACFALFCIVLQFAMLRHSVRLVSAGWVISSLVNVGLNLNYVPMYGIDAAAVTTLISYSSMLGLVFWLERRSALTLVASGMAACILGVILVLAVSAFVGNPYLRVAFLAIIFAPLLLLGMSRLKA